VKLLAGEKELKSKTRKMMKGWEQSLAGRLSPTNTKTLVSFFLRKGIDINSRQSTGFSAIHFAAQNGMPKKVIEFLIEQNTNEKHRTGRQTLGSTPLLVCHPERTP
jgi:ankyrin repeat protein